MKLSYSKLKKYACIYIALPVLVFAIGWLRPIWAVVVTLATIACLFFAFYRKKNDAELEESTVRIPISFLIIGALIALVWVWQSGLGGFWAQSKDYPWRNAIYRDIILRDWPVVYDQYGGVLVYYIGFWLFPSLFGKLALLFGGSAETAFFAGNIALMLWAAVGIFLLFLLLAEYFHCDTVKKLLFVILFFIFFSGMDILGSIEPLGANLYHLEWWADKYQYSSFTTCLFWVFNQSVIPWIAFMCILREKTVSNYIFLGMMCLFSGPLPFLGVFVYCIVLGICKFVELCKLKSAKSIIKQILSPSNLIATIFLFPVIGTYLLCNDALTGGAIRVSSQAAVVQESANGTDMSGLTTYLMFIMFEFGIYALLILRKYKKNPLYYVTVGMLLVLPFLKVGYGDDFPMRVSIPSLFFLYLLCTRFIMEEKGVLKLPKAPVPDSESFREQDKAYAKLKNKRLLFIILIICLILGAITPAVEFYRGARQVAMRGINDPISDHLYTLGGDGPYYGAEDGRSFPNFITTKPKEQKFFIYFAKESDLLHD